MMSTATAAVNAAVGVAGDEQPAGERRERDAEHDRHEHAGDAVDETLDRRLPGLRLGDEPRDLRERRLGADLRRADDEAPVRVDGRAGDLGPGPDVDGHGLAGEHRLVDRGARPPTTTPSVAIFSPGRTTKRSPAATSSIATDDLDAVAQHARLLRAELEQRPDRRARAAPRARLEVAPSRISVVITAATSKYMSASSRTRRATTDHAQAASVPIEMSVSIVAARWRAFRTAARWKPKPAQRTTGRREREGEPTPSPRTGAAGSSRARVSGAVSATATSSRVRSARARSSASPSSAASRAW